MCKATTKLGRPCRKQAVDRGLCVVHGGKLDMSALCKLGGRARGRKKEQHAGEKLEGLAHAAIEELLTNAGGSATARAATAYGTFTAADFVSPPAGGTNRRGAGLTLGTRG